MEVNGFSGSAEFVEKFKISHDFTWKRPDIIIAQHIEIKHLAI